MAIGATVIVKKLTEGLPASKVEIVDDSDGCGEKFRVIIVSDAFVGKPVLQRHKMVHSVLEEELKQIHAFSQKTVTNEEYERNKPSL